MTQELALKCLWCQGPYELFQECPVAPRKEPKTPTGHEKTPPELMHPLVQRAIAVAIKAHGEQKRKFTGAPYYTHVIRVALRLLRAGVTDPEVLAAAILHDTAEDTELTIEQIRAEFGSVVADLVAELTKKPSKEGESKRDYLNSFRHKSPTACLIKMADRTDNLLDGLNVKYYALEGARLLVACLDNERARPADASFAPAWTKLSYDLNDVIQDVLFREQVAS